MSNTSGQSKCYVACTGQPLVDVFFLARINLIHVQTSRTVQCPSQVNKANAMLFGQDSHLQMHFFLEGINLIHVQISRTVHCPSQVAKAHAMLLGQDSHRQMHFFLERINLIHVQISRTVHCPSQVAKAKAMLIWTGLPLVDEFFSRED